MALDTSHPFQLAMALAPKVPLITKTALLHTFGLTSTSQAWSLRTELTVATIRSFMTGPKQGSLSKVQRATIRDPGIKGKLWVSKVTAPIPSEDDVRVALFEAIEALKESIGAKGGYVEPELLPVEAEWTGFRAGATSTSPELRISEAEKYTELMKEATSPTTILYFHGGAHFLLDPASHRPTTSKLAKLTQGRTYSVRYRLSPQNPFPAALLDALVSYLTLLYPSSEALHSPVEPGHIVLAGDSAGGNVAFALLQLLLQLRRQKRPILWNGEERHVPLPGGVATNSAWLDITHSLPSCTLNAKTDYLPSFGTEPEPYPPCEIWPAKPPRSNIYAEDEVLSHPLVSPLAADWGGIGETKVWMGAGEELLTDENKHVAAQIVAAGGVVRWEQWEKMPHCFALVMPYLDAAKKYNENWAAFIRVVTHGEGVEMQTKGVKFSARDMREESVDVKSLGEFTHEEVKKRMHESVTASVAARERKSKSQGVPASLVQRETCSPKL